VDRNLIERRFQTDLPVRGGSQELVDADPLVGAQWMGVGPLGLLVCRRRVIDYPSLDCRPARGLESPSRSPQSFRSGGFGRSTCTMGRVRPCCDPTASASTRYQLLPSSRPTLDRRAGDNRCTRGAVMTPSKMAKPITVVVVSSVRLHRESLADLVERGPGVSVIGRLGGFRDVTDAISRQPPSVMLLDLPVQEGRAVIESLPRIPHMPRVIAFGLSESETEVVAWAEAGADGYLSRDASSDELIGAIEAVAHGELVCSPSIAAVLLRRFVSRSAHPGVGDSASIASLTSRERRVLELIDQGLTNKEIARQLCIEVSTVKNHVHNALEKLNVHRRSQAAAILRTSLRL
jgi:two-component system, NarL family, nitrate/nitrite response regulator NarL